MDTRAPSTRPQRTLWLLPALVLALGVAITGIMATLARPAILEQGYELAQREHRLMTERLEARIQRLLVRGRQLAATPVSRQAEFHDRARDFLDAHTRVTGVEYITTSSDDDNRQRVVRWVLMQPRTGNANTTAGLVADTIPHWRNAIDEALASGRATATTVTAIRHEGGVLEALRVFFPVRSEPGALISVVLRPEPWLAAQLEDLVSPATRVRVYDSSQYAARPLLSLHASGEVDADAALRSELGFANRQWLLATTPTREKRYRIWHRTLFIIITGGVLISLLGALACAILVNRYAHLRLSTAQLTAHSRRLERHRDNIQVEKQVLRRALDDSEQRSRDLVDLSGGVVGELDEAGRIGYISASATDLLGRPAAELADTPLSEIVAPPWHANLRATFNAAREERQTQRLDLELLGADDSTIPATLRVRAIADPVAGCSGYRIVIYTR